MSYLINYVCFKPFDDRKIPTERRHHLSQAYLGFDESRYLDQDHHKLWHQRAHLRAPHHHRQQQELLNPLDSIFEMATLDSLFANTGFSPTEVDTFVLNVSMFSPSPSLLALIINRYKMTGDIKVFDLYGVGCSTSLP